MSLFGKKNSDDLSIEDDGGDVQMNFDGGDEGGKKSRIMLIAGGLVVVLAGAGAFFMLSSEDAPMPPPRATAMNADSLPPEITQERPIDAPPMPGATGPDASPLADATGEAPPSDITGTSPLADTAGASPLAEGSDPTAAATDAENSATPSDTAIAAVPSIPGAAADTVPGAVANTSPLPADIAAGAPVPGAAADAATPPADIAIAPGLAGAAPASETAPSAADAALGLPPSDAAVPAVAEIGADPAAEVKLPGGDAAMPVTAPVAAADAGKLPGVPPAALATAADIAPIVPAASEDLPAPALPTSIVKNAPDRKETATGADTAPAAINAAKGAATQGTITSAPGAGEKLAVGDKPSKGEMAIVQNGVMLDQLTASPGADVPVLTDMERAILDANIQEALVRPLPKKYLVVTKTNEAGDVDSRLTAARSALARGNDTVALQLFNEIYKSYPKDNRVLMGRAVAMQRLGQSEQALAAYEEVLTTNPKNLEALTNMLGLIKKQNPGLAVEKLVDLREAYPNNADITAQLGVAYAGAGAYEDAARYLDMAEALAPGSPTVLYNKAVLYDKMGRSLEAGELYRQILRLNADGSLDSQLPIASIKSRLSTLR